MFVPTAIVAQPQIHSAVSEVARSLAPDVVHIRYSFGQDWSGDPAIYFRILLSDEASVQRLNEVADQVWQRLEERLDFGSMGLYAYYNVRNVSEQATLKDPAWA